MRFDGSEEVAPEEVERAVASFRVDGTRLSMVVAEVDGHCRPIGYDESMCRFTGGRDRGSRRGKRDRCVSIGT